MYDVKEHPDYQFRIGSYVMRVQVHKDDESEEEAEERRKVFYAGGWAGMIASMKRGEMEVLWCDGTRSMVSPSDVLLVELEQLLDAYEPLIRLNVSGCIYVVYPRRAEEQEQEDEEEEFYDEDEQEEGERNGEGEEEEEEEEGGEEEGEEAHGNFDDEQETPAEDSHAVRLSLFDL